MNTKKDKLPFYLSLKEIRESKDIDLQSISEATKINIEYLKSIDNGDLDIVPSTFLRLFIKSYAKFLKIDPNEVLKEYEDEKNITKKNIFKKITSNLSKNDTINEGRKIFTKEKNELPSKIEIKRKSTHVNEENIIIDNFSTNEKKSIKEKINLDDSKNNKLIFEDSNDTNHRFNSKENYFLKPRKIFTISFTLISIVSIYLLINYLNKNQIEQIINNDLIEEIDTHELDNQNQIDGILLNSLNFNENKLVDEKSYKLKFHISTPYTFKIVTNKKTKLYVSYDDDNGERKEHCNIIAKKDSLLKFREYNNIYFDLWSAKDVQIDIENNPLSKYLGKDDVSVRGSFEPENKLLYLKFYSR